MLFVIPNAEPKQKEIAYNANSTGLTGYAAYWYDTITHNLGKVPNVKVVNADNELIEPLFILFEDSASLGTLSTNKFTIIFSSSVTGTVYVD